MVRKSRSGLVNIYASRVRHNNDVFVVFGVQFSKKTYREVIKMGDFYTAIECRLVGVSDDEVKLDGRILKGFKNDSVRKELVSDILDNSNITVQTIGDKTTLVTCVLPNDFVIMEHSSCVHPSNYNESMGFDICMERIQDKVWELLGFLYQTALVGFNPVKTDYAKLIEEAMSIACEEMITLEHGEKGKALIGTAMFERRRNEAVALAMSNKEAIDNMIELAMEEDLSVEDLVEIVVALHMCE